MLRYEVRKLGFGWREVDQAFIMADGRLAWKLGQEKGLATPVNFRLAQSTLQHPEFKAMCRAAKLDDARVPVAA